MDLYAHYNNNVFNLRIWDALSKEILDAYNNTGRAISKKAEYHRKLYNIFALLNKYTQGYNYRIMHF